MTKQPFNKPLFSLLWLAGFVGELSTLWIDLPIETSAFSCCLAKIIGEPQ